ncbi:MULTISPECIES: hypothetical protein [Pseudomonas]|uniref:Uncharacterized protein n=1 Tax=Pseudomonas hunanensis TaxID=1247546 RepID=A0ACC6KAJ5_9PSED|nr:MULTISPECIES: hypothetical protein [Pseudomonas]MBP2263763.1 hypothetical protein [Pseudomonas sp. BP8]MDR6715417.1 hypothetical protein [Pseudomonas hunanensis]HDS1736785.1 hypothetical protein [Pseudomonas putida]
MKLRILAVLCAAALTGCGNDAIEGTFKVQSSVMGMRIDAGQAILKSDSIVMDGDKFEVDEWEQADGMVTARAADGSAIIHARVLDNGNRLEMAGEGSLLNVTLVRIK